MADRSEFARVLGFTEAWFAAGVVDDAVLTRQRAEWDKGGDDNPEHYRYRAFREFLAAHRPLTAELAEALFELGAADPDQAMGGAIMADIARLPECPHSVNEAGRASGRKHLVRIAERRTDERAGRRYVVRLMFEWGGGCLWCGNDAARAAFDVGPIEEQLSLTPATRQRLIELAAWHDGSLDWDYPPDPSPWSAEERERFEQAAAEVLAVIRSELGPEFEVVYVPL